MIRRWLFPGILIAAVLAVVEAMSFATGRILAQRGVLYVGTPIADYAEYLAIRDPDLGWPGSAAEGEPRDASGSRVVPAFPDTATSCGALYGDSFTWGADVAPREAWSNRLSERLGCRVANFGVSGYGSDQAFLRYRLGQTERAAPGSRFVVLAHLSENVIRNINQYRVLLYPSATTGFKPRFELAARGALELVPLPTIAEQEYARFVGHPERYLHHEFFAPGGAAGMHALRFPYTLAVLSAFDHFHVRAKLRGEPWYAAFYRREHPSHALQLTVAIVREFVHEARARNQVPVPMVLATSLDFEYQAQTGAWAYAPLVETLRNEGIEIFDAGAALLDRLAGESPSTLYAGAHHNPRGNALLAEVTAEHLARIGVRLR